MQCSLFGLLFYLCAIQCARLVRNSPLKSPIDEQDESLIDCNTLTYLVNTTKQDINALASFPGSGNSWLRHLLQQSTGLYTGSVYRDFELENGGLPGLHDSSVIIVKTHQLPSEPFPKYDKAILLIRNPFKTLLAEFNRRSAGHLGYVPITRKFLQRKGIVKSVDRMLVTLGGLENVVNVCSSSSLRLQLRFRPDDPFSHCAIADRLQLNNLLAKTIKKKVHYSDGTSEVKYETVIIGLIESTYKFETLADFQYLPIERTNFDSKAILDRIVKFGKSDLLNVDIEEDDDQTNNQNNEEKQADEEKAKELKNQSNEILSSLNDGQQATYKSIFKQVFPYDALNGEVRKFEENQPLFVMPIIFSRFDSPSDYFYRDDPKRKGVDEANESESIRQNGESAISLNRKSRAKYVYLITFQDEPPKERVTNQDAIIDEKLMAKIIKEFESHPIWTKSELAYRNKCKKKELKLILPICAFYYTNGPFRGQWVKFGYNPKENNESRFYQTLDLRTCTVLKKKFGPNKVREPAVYNSVKSVHTAVEKKGRESVISHEQLTPQSSKERKTNNNSTRIIGGFRRTYVDEVTDEREFKFIAGQMPKNRQIFYQLRNIQLDEVQEVLKSKPEDVCDERDGWWPAGTIDKIRSLTLDHMDKLLGTSQLSPPDEEDDEFDDSEV